MGLFGIDGKWLNSRVTDDPRRGGKVGGEIRLGRVVGT